MMTRMLAPMFHRHGLMSLFDNDLWESLPGNEEVSAGWPPVDVLEAKNSYVLRMDVPGVEEKDLKIEFIEGTLIIEGTRGDETSEDLRFHVRERQRGAFRRTFATGDGVQADKIQATFKNGTLTIQLPKAEKAVPRAIPITVTKH